MCLRPAPCGIFEAAIVVLQIHLNSFNSIVYDMYHQVFNTNENSALCPCTVCMCLIYLLTGIGLPPGGSSTVHIYTHTVHRTTQLIQTIHRITQLTNWEECRPCPIFHTVLTRKNIIFLCNIS